MPASTFAKEYFGYWVFTTDPLLTSAKWVAYGTEVQFGNLCKTHDFFRKVCALVLAGVFSYLGTFYVSVGMLDNFFLMFLPLLFGYLYILWVVPSRQILLQGLDGVCLHKNQDL